MKRARTMWAPGSKQIRVIKISADKQECRQQIKGLLRSLVFEGKFNNPYPTLDEAIDTFFEIVQAGITNSPTMSYVYDRLDRVQLEFKLN